MERIWRIWEVAMKKLVFDIGASNMKFALMTCDGQIVEREQIPTKYESAESYFSAMVQIVNRYQEDTDQIIISSNGRMKEDGTTYRAYTSSVLKDANVKEEMENRCGLPVVVLNDGSCAALGEWWKGAGMGCRNLLVLVLGSGVGAGMILNNELYEGSRLNASAMFNMVSDYEKGHYEFAGMPTSFIALQFKLCAAKGIPFEEMSGNRYFDFIHEKDPIAMGLLKEYCAIIAKLVYNAAMLLDLDRIVVTGGLAKRMEIMQGINEELAHIREDAIQLNSGPRMASTLFDPIDCTVQVVRGELTADANFYGILYHSLNQQKQCEED